MKAKLLERVGLYEDYAVELQRGLTAIPALDVSSGGVGELDKARWLEAELKKLKFDSIEWINAPQEGAKEGIRPNIVARYRGSRHDKTLWVMAHLDVVPPGALSAWKSDPYELKVEGRRMIGRGVEDNQQAVVSALILLRAMMDLDYRPAFDVALLLCADEETGSTHGAAFLAEKRPDLFGAHDMFFVPDGGVPDGSMIEIAEKSMLWLKITTQGKQCHSSRPDVGANAFKAASELVTRLQSLYDVFPERDALFDPPYSTFEPTKKEANVPNINTIPGTDVFYLDCRVMPCYTLQDVKAEIRRNADVIEKKHGVEVSFDVIQENQAAPPTPKDAGIVVATERAVREVYKVEPKVMGVGGGTVAVFFRRLGLPAVVYSRLEDSAHQANEYCIMDNIIGDARVFMTAILSMEED